jgi:peptidyl-prolyl cis-trans isomerase-like 4
LTKADLSSMNGKHTIFGKVEEGFDILRKINDSFTDKNNRPEMNIRILHTFILDDPFDDLPNMEVPIESPQIIRNSERL